MNIRSVSNFASHGLTGLDVRRRLFKLIPNITINGEAFANNIGTILSRPDVNRAIMGVTAIMTQPFIDYYNPNVDRDTANVSTFRTIGKIIAGTTVGCAVRSLCYYGTHALTSVAKNAPEWRTALLPPKSFMEYLANKNPDWLKNHRSVLATIIGLGAMLFTNVLLDVPLTNLISGKLIGRYRKNHPEPIKDPANTSNSTNPQAGREPYDVREKFLDIFVNNFNLNRTGGRHE
ncbi:MAG: hypothetical protein K6E29_08355 [Cyanobacteria bacterium RUI128]|nr:hypothetical protein [Cyanobacteria bacterium RUI128]